MIQIQVLRWGFTTLTVLYALVAGLHIGGREARVRKRLLLRLGDFRRAAFSRRIDREIPITKNCLRLLGKAGAGFGCQIRIEVRHANVQSDCDLRQEPGSRCVSGRGNAQNVRCLYT